MQRRGNQNINAHYLEMCLAKFVSFANELMLNYLIFDF